MKGLSGLWRNECFKIYRQTANKIIIIIALALSLLTPVFTFLINKGETFIDSRFRGKDYWEENAQEALEEKDYMQYCAWQSQIDANDFFENNSISDQSWKYQTHFSNYEKLLYHKYCLKYYIEGKIDKESFSVDLKWDFLNPDREGEYGYNVDDFKFDWYDTTWLDSFDAKGKLDEVTRRIADLENTLKTGTIRDFASEALVSLREELAEKKNELGTVKNDFEKGNASENDVLRAELDLEGIEYRVSFYESMAKTNVPEGEADWMLTTVRSIGSSACASLSTVPVSEEEFYKESYMYDEDDYGKYCEGIEKDRTNARRALKTVAYAIENGIPLPETSTDSTKDLARSSLSSVASIIIIAMVIVTANNVALEYSSGTIRLLLIRPRKRSKIILSKMLALFTTGMILSLAVFFIVCVASVILNGIGDMFKPDLLCFSNVVRINSLLYSLAKLFLPLISGLFLLSLAFMMAVWTRRAALAIVAPLIVNSFTSVLQMASLGFSGDHPILKYTILPYLDLGPYLISPVSAFAPSDLNITGIFSGLYGNLVLSSDVSALTGLLIVLIHVALLYGFAFVIFCKQQIKN